VESGRRERRWVALTLAVLFLMVVSRSLPGPVDAGPQPVLSAPTEWELDAVGGRPPRDLKVCALSIGMFVGGLAGMSLNPLMGAACITWGFNVALVTCI